MAQVVEVLREALTPKGTPIPSKATQLMLVSDVLHNSNASVNNSFAYRTSFEARLPDITGSFMIRIGKSLHESLEKL